MGMFQQQPRLIAITGEQISLNREMPRANEDGVR
jgi:hypothetical protein